ncbi:MAG: alpha/beta hydrolase [Bacillaceae bacterium]
METKIHSQLRDILATMPPFALQFPDTIVDFNNQDNLKILKDYRAVTKEQVLKTASPPHESISISNQFILGHNDAPAIRIRIYEPQIKNESLPGVLWIHGGGYIAGCPEEDDILCQRFVLEANCIVVSVDYRLAPENPFPSPLEDCYTALEWFVENASKLGVDHSRIGVAGASAGGGLTAAVSLLARDRQGPSIAFQMPLYPMIDDRNITPSSKEITDNRVWNAEINQIAWQAYLGSTYEDDVPFYAAPARINDLSGLPPTYTCIGDLDPFRDETIDYVAKLTKAGVPTEFHLYPGCFHAFDVATTKEVSQRAVTQYVQALKHGLQK